jgi:hypothetical protein
VPGTDINPGVGVLLIDYIAEPWEYDTQGPVATNRQNNPYYLFAMHEEYKYILYGIQKKGMQIYYDNVQNLGYTTPRFP